MMNFFFHAKEGFNLKFMVDLSDMQKNKEFLINAC